MTSRHVASKFSFHHAGTEVVYVLTTNGDTGWNKDTSMTREQLAVTRYQEQFAAAGVLNVSHVTMLDFSDSFLNNAPEKDVRQLVVAAIRRYKPKAIFTWSPYLDFTQYAVREVPLPCRTIYVATTEVLSCAALYTAARPFSRATVGILLVSLLLALALSLGRAGASGPPNNGSDSA